MNSTDQARDVIKAAVPKAREILESEGYVVVKATTYRNLQERARRAERQVEVEQEHNRSTQRWAEAAFEEQHRLAERCTFLYGEARARGASREDLAGGMA